MAGWNFRVANPFRRRPAKRAKTPPPADLGAVVRPLTRVMGSAVDKPRVPGFQATASDQPSSRSGNRFVAMHSKLRNAFTPSQPVADRRMFAGRDDILSAIIHSIEDQRLHIVIYGERGIGKTSLLHMLAQAAADARYIVIYTSCGANSSFDDAMRTAATDIPVLFHSGFAPTDRQAEKGDTLADLLPEGPVSPRRFADLCAKLTGTRVLIILDEFDRCESSAFRRDVAELTKHLSDRRGRVQLVLAGVAADLTQLIAHIPPIRRNRFAQRVPKMSDDEVLKIIANGEREVGFSFEPAATELVVAVSRGSPYLANLLCHHAAHDALSADRPTVTASDIVNAVDRTSVEFEGRIGRSVQKRVQRLIEQDHAEDLAAAARASMTMDGAFSLVDLQEINQIDSATATRTVKLLLSDGLLVPANDEEERERFEFCEEGLPMYLWISAAQRNLQAKRNTKATAAAN
ncbi:ATP-binding protein [uncultured Phenylobacterium sp.]|uniref:ATP-binding protein n=1 Tax=uncultured Phenylobacterium sp. TaxID=349273 RepID=UPI0025D51D7F|nr:ATP-binding protein [uncultured Phenylobacterium sp.]